MLQEQRIPEPSMGENKKQVEQANNPKIRRFTIWAVFLILIGGLAAIFLPEHSVGHFFDLLKEIIINLIVGA